MNLEQNLPTLIREVRGQAQLKDLNTELLQFYWCIFSFGKVTKKPLD